MTFDKPVLPFIATTTIDMVEERKYMMKNVYPQLKDFCSKVDLEFELFDLSADTVNEATRMDQLLPEIRRRCIDKVQNNTVGPNLMVITFILIITLMLIMFFTAN